MPSQFTVLTTSGADSAEWSATIARLPHACRDIHFLPEYGRVYQATHGVVSHLACLDDDEGLVVQPFVSRDLSELPFFRQQGIAATAADIANPYGYGGPIYATHEGARAPRLVARFEEAFLRYCEREQLASEFCSLHPLFDVSRTLAETGMVTPKPEKRVVYLDLSADEAEIWRRVRKGHKWSISKARRSGVHVARVEGSARNLEAFKNLYYATMQRNQAASRWRHPDSYFGNCLNILGDRRASFHFATVDGQLAAATILMHDFEIAYYHFAGSDPAYNATCAGTLLVYECALWARRQGYRIFHLGGGVSNTSEDGLYLFKSGFSDLTATLYTYTRVLHAPTYRWLSEAKIRHEQQEGWSGQEDYFPLYRR